VSERVILALPAEVSGGVSFDHLSRLCDRRGLFEHADHVTPRHEHGYCTDDNARLLVIAARESATGSMDALSRLALAFVLDAQEPSGLFHNRMNIDGQWTDAATDDDWWGRSVWALGVASVQHRDASVRRCARAAFDRSVEIRSRWPHAMAFAALGAASVLVNDPASRAASGLLGDALSTIGEPPLGAWQWPLPRLTYANAALAEAVIAAGAALGSHTHVKRGLRMLSWLIDLQTRGGVLSIIGTAGLCEGDLPPRDGGAMFDQQPIEVAAIADACWLAYRTTGDAGWRDAVRLANAWFDGTNDTGAQMHDVCSGGGYDGLHSDRVNLNQGAESTLAFISARQRARSLVVAT
jgi:hypothetical protein